jgi:hypothetical protein
VTGSSFAFPVVLILEFCLGRQTSMMMSTTNLKSSLGIVMLATASSYSYHKSTSSSATWMSAVVTASAAVVGVIAVMSLVGKKTSNNHQRRASHDDVSDTISVEGSVMVTLPTWAIASSEEYFSRRYTSDEEMMSLAIHLSDMNSSEGTGGPFGAAIFERHEEKGGGSYCTLASIGMNRVVPLGNSTLHGEVRLSYFT